MSPSLIHVFDKRLFQKNRAELLQHDFNILYPSPQREASHQRKITSQPFPRHQYVPQSSNLYHHDLKQSQ